MSNTQTEITWTPSPTAEEWNPRFLAFARVHGRTPVEQLAHDDERWPGGRMAGFITWLGGQRSAARADLTAVDGQRRHWLDGERRNVTTALVARLASLDPCPGCPACEDRP